MCRRGVDSHRVDSEEAHRVAASNRDRRPMEKTRYLHFVDCRIDDRDIWADVSQYVRVGSSLVQPITCADGDCDGS